MPSSDEILAELEQANAKFLALNRESIELSKRRLYASAEEASILTDKIRAIEIELCKTEAECDRLTLLHIESLDLPEDNV